jgi:hypothetical protein
MLKNIIMSINYITEDDTVIWLICPRCGWYSSVDNRNFPKETSYIQFLCGSCQRNSEPNTIIRMIGFREFFDKYGNLINQE